MVVATNRAKTSTFVDRSIKPSIAIVKDVSALGEVERFRDPDFVELPHGDCGDGIVNPFPSTVVANKYWAQRHRLFSKFDQGCQLDPEAWYSVTPEAIARHVADQIVSRCTEKSTMGAVVLDAFGGVGGNTVAMALHTGIKQVICVDTNPERLSMAAFNCKVYGVAKDAVVFIQADALEVMQAYKDGMLCLSEEQQSNQSASQSSGYTLLRGVNKLPEFIDAVFLSPPWGGMDYMNIGRKRFGLECITLNEGNVKGNTILAAASRCLGSEGVLAYFVPRNTNGLSAGCSFFKAGYNSCTMEQNVLNGKLKTITIYGTKPGKLDSNQS